MNTKEGTITDVSKTCIWISLPDTIHNNFGIQIFSYDNPEIVEKFRKLCYELLMAGEVSKKLSTFHQGETEGEWHYFEFLRGSKSKEVQDLALELGERIATELGLELEIK